MHHPHSTQRSRPATPSKTDSALLPPFVGLGLDAIIVPTSEAEFALAVEDIKQVGIVGFDTESKPTFKVGEESTGPHILQFATREKAYIFQVGQPACRAFTVEVLASNDVQKIGFGLESDRAQILKKFGITMNEVIDLNAVFRREGYRQTAGVRAAVAIVLGQKFHKSKRISTTNWSLPTLTPQQLLYAANDAYAALMVMDGMSRWIETRPSNERASPAP